MVRSHLPLFILSTFFLLSCQSKPAVAPLAYCLDERQEQKVLTQVEAGADALATTQHKPITGTELLEKACHKNIYLKNGLRIVIYKDPLIENSPVSATVMPASDFNKTSQCFKEAIQEIRSFDQPMLKDVLATNENRFGWQWNDMDIGPVKWLNCKDDMSMEWFTSLGDLVHELNHQNREESCLHYPGNGTALCLNLSSELPRRSLAKMKRFPTRDKGVNAALLGIQKIYLTQMDEPPLILFDELNSYILTNKVMTEVLRKHGATALFKKDGRGLVLLPLFMFYSARYILLVKNKKPELYAKNFTPFSENMNNLKVLFSQGEKVYNEWVAELAKQNSPQAGVENALWQQYLLIKGKLNL